MCRHLAYLGPRVPLREVLTEPEWSLYRQSWAPRRQAHGTVNADGFGVGWYAEDDPVPARYRRAVPIWADPSLLDLTRVVRTHALLAAVRSATAGTSADESSAAPYTAGQWLFSHNGALPGWPSTVAEAARSLPAEELLSLESRCDSALVWALVLHGLRSGAPPHRALADTIARLGTGRLNLLLTDGTTITATAWGDTLYYRQAPGRVLVASEPTGDDPDWTEVPDHTLLRATRFTVELTPLTGLTTTPTPTAAAERTHP
ncbi:ergothioneine biosynthesis protein EgtC [Streptomyces capparidis]